MKEKRPVRRIILSIIAIAVIIAMVAVMILASVRAEETQPDTHPAVTIDTSGHEETFEEKNLPANESSGTEGADPDIDKEKNANDADESVTGTEKDPSDGIKTVGSENAGPDSTLLHVRQRPCVIKGYKDIPDIKSKYAVVMDADANAIIAGKQPGARMFPASLTKVMTLLTAVDFLPDMNRTFTISLEESDYFYSQNASVAGYAPGEPAKASEMLYGLILPSGADCALGLAKVTAGSMETFTTLMNLEGIKMGLRDSHFSNTSGLHDESNYSTALDLSVIFRYAMDNELCRKVLGTPSYKTEKTAAHPDGIELWSHTFSYMTGVDMGGFEVIAGKTGFTTEAGACMVTAASREDKTYIVVTGYALNSRDMCSDHIDIYKRIAEGKLK